jgi:hypothetical protein
MNKQRDGYDFSELHTEINESAKTKGPQICQGKTSIGAHFIVVKEPCFTDHFVMEERALFGDPSLRIGGYP